MKSPKSLSSAVSNPGMREFGCVLVWFEGLLEAAFEPNSANRSADIISLIAAG